MVHWLSKLWQRPARPAKPRRKLAVQLDQFARRVQANSGQGGFQGAKVDRITEEWNPGTQGPNRVFSMDGRRLRERARDLYANNPIARSAIEAYIANVLEQGITPRPQFVDRETRQLWINAWQRWGGSSPRATREADVTADCTFYELQELWLRELLVAGGCLVHYVETPRRGRLLPLALELIPEERFAEHLLTAGRNPKTSNPVLNGIEYDPASGRTLAYHVLPTAPNDDLGTWSLDPLRLPADECEYAFFKTRAGQKRGHTLLHAAIVWLWALGYYTDNELFASQVKSNWAYMIKSAVDESGAYTGLADDNPETALTDAYGNPLEKLEPGMIFRGKPGDEISAVGPNVPGNDSLPWLLLIQRSIAVGCGQSYEEMMGDYSKGNMASTRMGANSVRKRYRMFQRFSIQHFSNPAYNRFVRHAVRAGLEGFPTPADFVRDEDTWLRVGWSRPIWESINPVDDAQAAKTLKEAGLLTDREYVESRGGDLDEHYEQLEQERIEKEQRGLIFASDPEEQQNLTETIREGGGDAGDVEQEEEEKAGDRRL